MNISPFLGSFTDPFNIYFHDRSPTILTDAEKNLGYWAVDTFQLKEMPTNISSNYQDYKDVKKYLKGKGPYSPSKMFLDHVFHMITNDEFILLRLNNIDISHELQRIETRMFYQSGGMNSLKKRFATSVAQTASRMKEARKLGIHVEIDRTFMPDIEEGSVPSLLTLCTNVLVKNGHPHEFIDSDSLG